MGERYIEVHRDTRRYKVHGDQRRYKEIRGDTRRYKEIRGDTREIKMGGQAEGMGMQFIHPFAPSMTHSWDRTISFTPSRAMKSATTSGPKRQPAPRFLLLMQPFFGCGSLQRTVCHTARTFLPHSTHISAKQHANGPCLEPDGKEP